MDRQSILRAPYCSHSYSGVDMCPLKLTEADLQRALPDMSSTYRLPGLDGSIEIIRDGYGIPHVRAATMHDVFFGQGFATTQDRLWHMDYDRRRAYGRWAEFAGKAAAMSFLQRRGMEWNILRLHPMILWLFLGRRGPDRTDPCLWQPGPGCYPRR